MLKKIRNHVLTGLLVVLPLFVSVVILNWLFKFTTNGVVKFLPGYFKQSFALITATRIAVLIGIFVLLALVGAIARVVIIRKFFGVGEHVLIKIPLFNTIYTTVKQISELFLAPEKTPFRRVVLLEFPKKGVYSLGFVTSQGKCEIQNKLGDDVLHVFVPTTPNPTTGFLLFVKRSEVMELNMPAEDGMKLVISAGVITPNM